MQIELGLLSPSVTEQLNKAGISSKDKEELKRIDMDADAISRLHIRNLITETEALKARNKLMKNICININRDKSK